MSEERRDPVRELEDQMRAADNLIRSLEEEVVDLRRDLEQAGEALRAAQEEMAARSRAFEELEESRRALVAAEEEARSLRAELGDLKQKSADEQLRLRNEHIAGLAALRAELEEQRRAEVAAAESEGKIGALREAFRKERAALEEGHKNEVEELKRSAEQWEEQLRDGYWELEERHKTEVEELNARIEALRAEAEGKKADLERTVREELRREHEEDLRAERERHASELRSLRSAAASRELELQKELDSAIEERRADAEELRHELERRATEAEERRKKDLEEIKSLAERRERELKQAHSARLAEEKEEAKRRVSTLKAQREADINTLQERHARELAKVRQELEARLATEEERRKSEAALLEVRLEGARTRQESETRLYGERLKELESGKVADKEAAEEELEQRLAKEKEERTRLEDRVAGLQDALEESGTLEAELREDVEAARYGGEDRQQEDVQVEPAEIEELEERLKEADAERHLAKERAEYLEARLRDTEEENRRRTEELEKTREGLRKVSDPEQRLRAGISLFNASDQTRIVASISKALGLPKVHVGSDGGPDSQIKKPVLTFVWSDMAWRRYVSDPTEGVEEPRVYLIGAGDDPADMRRPDLKPNARMDAQGRLILGVQGW
ncbi:MAG: hypothetical protein ICV57_02180 [Rubrobacter sp.]|nr:hypothetical protein [Rubrobacter sp.]